MADHTLRVQDVRDMEREWEKLAARSKEARTPALQIAEHYGPVVQNQNSAVESLIGALSSAVEVLNGQAPSKEGLEKMVATGMTLQRARELRRKSDDLLSWFKRMDQLLREGKTIARELN